MHKIPLAGTAPALLAIACGLVVTAAEAAPVANLPLTCSSADAIGQPQNNCNGDWAYQLPNTDQLIVVKGPSSVWSRASSLTNSDTVSVCTLPVEPGAYSSCRDAAGVRRLAFVPKSQVFPDSSPPPSGSTGARVLDLSAPVVVNEAGLYILDRDWSLGGLGPSATLLEIAADNVTLDMQGFEFSGDSILIWIKGKFVTVRNGRLSGGALIGSGRAMLVEAMRVTGNVDLFGGGSVLANSFVTGTVLVERGVTARNNLITSREGSEWAVLAQHGAYVLDNQLSCSGETCVTITGGGTVVSKNVITSTGTAIKIINAAGNQVLDNVVLVRTHAAVEGSDGEPSWIYRSGEVAIDVAAPGGGNIIRGNFVERIGGPEVHPWRVGIRFGAGSERNAYGDNLMYADVPYDLGATVQIDLGGNQPL